MQSIFWKVFRAILIHQVPPSSSIVMPGSASRIESGAADLERQSQECFPTCLADPAAQFWGSGFSISTAEGRDGQRWGLNSQPVLNHPVALSGLCISQAEVFKASTSEKPFQPGGSFNPPTLSELKFIYAKSRELQVQALFVKVRMASGFFPSLQAYTLKPKICPVLQPCRGLRETS